VARRQQRRPAFRPNKGGRSRRTQDQDTAVLDVGARRVLVALGRDAQRLTALVHDLRQLRDEADRVAYAEPSPEALREYRRAARELAEAERALVLAGGA
jgi:hypothetical protein